jgi:hypothetical protein
MRWIPIPNPADRRRSGIDFDPPRTAGRVRRPANSLPLRSADLQAKLARLLPNSFHGAGKHPCGRLSLAPTFASASLRRLLRFLSHPASPNYVTSYGCLIRNEPASQCIGFSPQRTAPPRPDAPKQTANLITHGKRTIPARRQLFSRLRAGILLGTVGAGQFIGEMGIILPMRGGGSTRLTARWTALRRPMLTDCDESRTRGVTRNARTDGA